LDVPEQDHQAPIPIFFHSFPDTKPTAIYQMPKFNPLSTEANALVLIAAEAQARRSIAKLANIQSGALPVLALLFFRYDQGRISRPSDVYAANIANEPLVRSYIRLLIGANLIALTVRRGRRTLAPTLEGIALASKYYRALRTGRRQIETAI
jgi:hypothetical protein